MRSYLLKFIENGFVRVAIFTVVILLIPLIAMQFTIDVNWNEFDFMLMGGLCFFMGSLFVVASRKAPQRQIIIGFVFIVVFVYLWAELAVGIFTELGS
jgi:hypothetical protein